MLKRSYLFIIAIAFTVLLAVMPAIAEQQATAEDGRKVLLKDDGTWTYVEEQHVVATENPDFRNASWGMSMQQVMATEAGEPASKDGTSLVYLVTVASLSCGAVYTFVDGKLAYGGYVFSVQHSNRNGYIDDYEKIKGLLSQKYGTPAMDRTVWLNDLYKDDKDDWGMAIAVGHLTYYTSWNLPHTTVLQALKGDNYEITHLIRYSSTELAEATEAADRKNNLEGL